MVFKAHINAMSSLKIFDPSKHRRVYVVPGATSTAWRFLSIYTRPPAWANELPTNIAPENDPSQKETSIPTIHFQGIC